MFHEHRINEPALAEILPLNEKIDFYFDKYTGAAKEVASDWEDFASSQAESIRSLYGTMPRFEDDEECLPLQAADYWSWWVRKIYEDKEEIKTLRDIIFKDTTSNKSIPSFGYTFSEDQLVTALIQKVRSGSDGVGPDVPIYDAKYNPRPASNRVKSLTSSQRSKIRRLRGR